MGAERVPFVHGVCRCGESPGRDRGNSKVMGGLADRDAEAARTSKMANAITGVTHAAPAGVKAVQPQAAPQAAPANQKASQPQPGAKAPAPNDTVQISTAAHTALQESRETSTQTAQEPSRGDRQAARLLAKQAAAKKS